MPESVPGDATPTADNGRLVMAAEPPTWWGRACRSVPAVIRGYVTDPEVAGTISEAVLNAIIDARAVSVSDQPDREELARRPDLIDGQGNRWVWNPDGYRTRPSSTRIWMRAEIERRWPPVVEAGPAAEQPVQPAPDVPSEPPETMIYRIAREVSGIQNWDQVRDFQAAHCAQVRKTIEVYRRLLAEDQPVQPAPDVIARFLETGTAEQNIHLHEQNVELRRLLAAAQGAASAGTGEPETFSQEIARKHEENLREQARSDYEAIQEAKRRAPAPDRVVSDPGREREGDDV